MSNAPQPQKPPTSALAVVGLVMTLLCMQPVAFILSLVALLRINGSKGALGGQALAIIALCLTLPMCGISAAVAIPGFVKYQCNAKQTEAKASLKALYVAEEAFKGEHNAYSKDMAALNFNPHGMRYTYEIVEATPSVFRAEARAGADLHGDVWQITQDRGALTNTTNGCTR